MKLISSAANFLKMFSKNLLKRLASDKIIFKIKRWTFFRHNVVLFVNSVNYS